VLLRYLTSKGLSKDSASLSGLSGEDIQHIKSNITNYRMKDWSYFHKRIYELVNEYDEFTHNRTVNGHSLSMRLYFWKAAIHVIKHNFITGVGTGDVQAELNQAYKETEAPLTEDWYKRPHNQFLTITVALGILGVLIFIFQLFYPAMALRKELHWIYWPFFVMAVISFLIEDTLETQAGLTFYAFFNTLFVSMAYFVRDKRPEEDATAPPRD
jgi:O-antigen ligase